MANVVKGMVGAVVAVVALVVLAAQTGVVSLHLPSLVDLGLAQLPRIASNEATLIPKTPAVITLVEPIALDCRSRIHVAVSVEGRREHELLGATYRTDVVTVDAVGDVDTCVEQGSVQITEAGEGVRVQVPGDAIRFVRPRVDAVATATGVDYDKGFLGELTDLVPGVADGDDLITGAYAYAQQVIGGDACMEEAFEVTRQALERAYADQAVAQGIDPALVDVQVGTPDFDDGSTALDALGGLAFTVPDGAVRCTLSPNAHGGASPGWEDVAGTP